MFKPKLKILAVALVACSTSALADSNVTLYGRLDRPFKHETQLVVFVVEFDSARFVVNTCS